MRSKPNGVSINVDEIKTQKAKREKLFHISKRMVATKRFLIGNRIVSILASLLLCALIFNIFAPGKFFEFFGSLFNGVGFTNNGFSVPKFFTFLYGFAIILGIGIALLPAFKMKYWNLGAEGQILIGGLCAAIVSRFVGPHLPQLLTVLVMILAAAIGGALWAVIPAIFRAFFDTNETLFTLMMNYLAMGVVTFLANLWDPAHGQFAGLTNGMFNKVLTESFGRVPSWVSSLLVVIIVLLMAGFVFVYVKYTKHGYELSVVGESVNTAKYVGIDVKKTIIRTLVVSGALCGLVGWLILAGQTHSIEMNSAGGRGFTGVLVAWLGHFDVVEILVMSLLVGFISTGSSQAATQANINNSFSSISIAVFFFVILAFEFFANYEMHLNTKNHLGQKIKTGVDTVKDKIHKKKAEKQLESAEKEDK